MSFLQRYPLLVSICLGLAAFGCGEETDTGTTPGTGGMGGGNSMTSPEICDGLDNDQDGREDEGNLRRACNTACGSGIETCSAGLWAGCTAEDPQTEECDGKDNDCDGQIDEQLQRPCENACGTGSETCRQGSWVQCSAPSIGMEECDGEDNDCDGETDENLYRQCNAECAQGNEQCVGGVWGGCNPTAPAQEVCGDDLDNDCDGTADEQCDCTEGDTRPCSTDVGACIRGAETCRANGQWGPCVDPGGTQVTRPGELEEQCNGIDDDCNGVTDDIIGEPCGSSDVGACEFGVLRCSAGVLMCDGGVQAVAEVCDNLDNDCDGTLDEGLRVDNYETNNTCRTAEGLGRYPRDTVQPRVVSGTLYPDGDTDWYNLIFEEGRDLCVPFVNWGETDYEVSVQLTNVPEGATYQLCVRVAREEDVLADACEEPDVLEEQCADVGDVQTITAFVEASCGSNDSTHVLARVQALGESPFSCEEYTLSFSARIIED